MTQPSSKLPHFIWSFLLTLMFLSGMFTPQTTLAKERIAILELSNPAGLTQQEITYLSEHLRGLVSNRVGDQYITIDKATMFTLLPPGMTPECLDEARCEIEMGQMMQATYIITGSVIRFGRNLRLTIRLYDTRTGRRVGSEVASGTQVDDMETGIQEAGGRLLRRLRQDSSLRSDSSLSSSSPVTSGITGRTSSGGVDGGSERRRIGGESSRRRSESQRRLIVTLRSEPAGAVISIDGVQRCSEGAQTCQIELTEGAHQVRMSKTDYFERSGSVTFSESRRLVEWKLDPNFATLEVRVTPSSLRYSINGDEQAGYHARRITPGKRYRVVSADRCYESSGEEVKAGQTGESLTVRLAPNKSYATLDLSARDPNGAPLKADVYIDDQWVGSTPGQFQVWVCASRLRLSHSVHGEDVSRLSLDSDEMVRRVVTLNGSAGVRARRLRLWGWTSLALALASAGLSSYGYTQAAKSEEMFISTRGNLALYNQVQSNFEKGRAFAYGGLGGTVVFSVVSAILFSRSHAISSSSRFSVAPTPDGPFGTLEWRW